MILADVVVVGSGIAGASVACELAAARGAGVLLLERERQPGYHTTGRSAALFIKSYGNAVARALTVASEAFYLDPPDGFAEHPVLTPRGELFVARADQLDELDRALAEIRVQVPQAEKLDEAQIRAIVPGLRPGYAAAGIHDADARDMDVHAILTGFLRLFRRRGGQTLFDAEVTAIERRSGAWQIRAGTETVSAPILVNAAGAWGDRVAVLAGATPVGIRPLRRTAFMVPAPPGYDIGTWPGVSDIGESWYIKPDAGRLLCSPADETPSDPCDAWPEDIDVAIAVERIQQAIDIEVTRVERSWAGLRTFGPDRTPVVGYDPRVEGFFWLVGQGGYGIQTAPAMARTAAALVEGAAAEAVPLGSGLTALALAPTRLAG